MHDLVIRGATVCDGTGRSAFAASLAVDRGRITGIDADTGRGREEIDADGLVLAPGFIDGHTHFDAQLTWDPCATPSPALGVTTVIIGNCGFTIAPCRREDRDRTLRNLTRVEGMSIEVLRAGVTWEFETFPEYLEALERRGTVPNVAAYIGHSSVRTWVMGESAAERTASSDELAAMAEIVVQAMDAGAVGFATSTAEQHNGDNGVPMPSRLADEDELRALVKAMGANGNGVFMLTKGNRTTVPFLESLAAESGRPVMIAALLHNRTNPDSTFADLRQIAAARARGRVLYGQVSCCPVTNDFTMRAPYAFEGLAAWRPATEARSLDERKRIYADPGFRGAVRDELSRPATVRLFNGEWDRLYVIETARAENGEREGRSVAELAATEGKEPLDWLLDFALAENLETTFMAELLNSDEEAVGRMLRDANSSIALSDAGAHLTFFCDAGFGLHLLGHWQREAGLFTLEEAVHELTGRPAAIYGISERGRIARGCSADLVLFDPATVNRGPKQRVRDLPGGAPRLTTAAVGLHGVWVNGTRIADQTGLLGAEARPGRILRQFAA